MKLLILSISDFILPTVNQFPQTGTISFNFKSIASKKIIIWDHIESYKPVAENVDNDRNRSTKIITTNKYVFNIVATANLNLYSTTS